MEMQAYDGKIALSLIFLDYFLGLFSSIFEYIKDYCKSPDDARFSIG